LVNIQAIKKKDDGGLCECHGNDGQDLGRVCELVRASATSDFGQRGQDKL
jgi:hypothetical protein